MEDVIVNQMNLLLLQVRFMRRALEDIERSTAKYGGASFGAALAAGPRFGEPPLFQGALKVWVVNINDLAPGAGFGAFLEGLLGGVGRFFGGLVGGVIGGTMSSLLLARLIPQAHALAVRVENILRLLGIGTAPPVTSTPVPGAPPPVATTTGSNWVAQLATIKHALDVLTGFFTAASAGPEAAARTSSFPATPEGDRWLRLLNAANATLTSLGHVVSGLIIAVPLLLASLASFIVRLADIRVAIAETLQFLLRNLLLLRGSLLVTLFDTFAWVARIGAQILGVVRGMVTDIITSAFTMLIGVVRAVVQLATVLGEAIKQTIDQLLNWVVNTLDTVLRGIGNTRVFRLITHLVRILPAILPPIYEIVKDRSMDQTSLDALSAAGSMPLMALAPGPPGTGPAVPPAPPDIGQIFRDTNLEGGITRALTDAQGALTTGITGVARRTEDGLTEFAGRLDAASAAESNLSSTSLATNLERVRTRSQELAGALVVGEPTRPETGLEVVATAYEQWLTNGGLGALLGSINSYFRELPPSAAAEGLPGRNIDSPTVLPSRATIDIGEVVIEIEAPSAGASLTGAAIVPPGPGAVRSGATIVPVLDEEDELEKHALALREFGLRGGNIDTLFRTV